MIILDTNVISELWKIAPNSNVLEGIDAQAIETIYLFAITVAELRYGLATMPEGRRRAIYREHLMRLGGNQLPSTAVRNITPPNPTAQPLRESGK